MCDIHSVAVCRTANDRMRLLRIRGLFFMFRNKRWRERIINAYCACLSRITILLNQSVIICAKYRTYVLDLIFERAYYGFGVFYAFLGKSKSKFKT